MKKRLMCLLLGVITVLSLILTSCSSGGSASNIVETASESALTLTMWVVSEEKVSDETAASVSKALNSITKSKFKINLIMNFYTEDEYRSKLEETILAYEADLKNRVETLPPETVETESGDNETVVTDETETNEYGQTVIKYPEAVKNQVDIIYISGEDMYLDFIENGWLASLDAQLSGASKKIKEYVSSTLLSAAKQSGVTYAVPNNHAIGEYTYMLLNKELMEKYSQQGYVQTGKIDGFYNEHVYSFLNLVSKFESDTTVPIDATYDYCLDLLAHYWSIDPDTYGMLDEFSVFGYHYKNMEELNRGSVVLGYNSLFEDDEFCADYIKLNQFRFDEYFGDATQSNKKSAVKFISGDYSILSDFETKGYCVYEGVEYYPVTVAYPTASTTDIYENMFGVCAHSKDVDRSMKIITYLNTNADFRNLLQYGIEGVNYKLEEEDDGKTTLVRLNEDYMMDIYSTGNVFITYPEPEMSEDIWEKGKIQNRYSLVDPLLGLDFAGYSATTGEAPAEVEIDSKVGYTVKYSTGYSKDVLSQNDVLKKWMNECDKAGKGVYVLQTSESVSINVTYNYYVYNNNLSKNTIFTVDDLREVEVSVNDKGKETITQTNLDFTLTYQDAEGSSKNGYELSLVSLYTKKNNEFEILCKVNDTATDIKFTTGEDFLDFDFYNTDEFTVEIYEKMKKATINSNSALKNWLAECDSNLNNKPTTYMLTYETKPVDGKVETTYLIYRTALKNATELQVIPTGNSGELNMIFNFVEDPDYEIDTSVDANYIFYQVRVVSNEDADAYYTFKLNGVEEPLSAIKLDSRKESSGDKNPDFVILGNLDTELVKYLYELNQDLIARLDACKDIEEMKRVVAEMKLLLSTKEEPQISWFKELKSVAQKYSYGNLFTDFHRIIKCATTTETVKIMEQDPEDPNKQVEGQFTDANGVKEPYIYYASPYAIYTSWLKTYGFMPKEK